MPFQRPTLTQLVDRIKTDIESRLTNGEKLIRRSVLSVLARVMAGAVHLLYSFLTYSAENLFASTADQEGLEKIGDEYGIKQEGAIQAEGTATVTGTDGTTIFAGSELQDALGTQYAVSATTAISGGTATLSLIAAEGGDDGNQTTGAELSFLVPITGVTGNAVVDSPGITGGVDAETTEEFRQRILRRKQYPPYGGTANDYETWILEYPAVTRAWVIPEYQGAGTVGCVFVNDNASPITPDLTFRNNVRAYLVSHEDPATGRTVGIPVTAEPGLYMLEASELDVDFEINTTPNNATTQAEIQAELEDLLLREGGAGETIYLSDITTALSRVQSITQYNLVSPVAPVVADNDEVHVLGTITYGAI